MNAIAGISFRETRGGLEVKIRKNTKGSKSGKLKKRLPYNFKLMSKQIMQAKTPETARPLIAKMQAKLSWLYKKLKSGEYGDSEVMAAIIHAGTMERIAKRKVRHLEEEEAAENGGSASGAPGEDSEIFGKEELKECMEENEKISEEMMEKMMKEIEKLEKEMTQNMMSEMQDMISCAGRDLSEEEIDELKRKHRSDEEKQLTRADLKYLKAMFERYEQEKRQASSGGIGSSSSDSGGLSFAVECVPQVEMTDMSVGECVDVSI